MQDAPKAVWSITYVSVAFFPSLKQNFIVYRSSTVSYCIFEIHQLWQSGFSRVYSNWCCKCSFEAKIIKISQSTHKMYSNHHHHIPLVARISLTLSRHSSLSFIALGRSSGQHPVSSHRCWMYVRAGRPAFARPCVRVHKSTSLMSSSLLLQQCPACLVRLTWIVFVIGGRWPYSWCLVGFCRQDLFKIARSINFQASTTISNAHTKKVWKLIVCTSYISTVTETH